MTSERGVGAAIVTVDGSPLDAKTYEDLLDTRVEQSVHLPDRFSLRFRDPHFELVDAETFGIGKAVDIKVGAGRGAVAVARGEVTAIAVEEGASGRHELVVSGLDRAHRLARGQHIRTFTNVKDSAVASRIAQEHGLRAEVDSTSLEHEYLLQRGTDYDFLWERAQAVGCAWWVSGDTLFFKNEPKAESGPALEFGRNLVRFRVRASCAEAAREMVVRSWDPNTQQPIVGRARMDDPDAGTLGTSASLASTAVKAAASFGRHVRRGTGNVSVSSVKEAETLARSMADAATGDFLVAKGESLGIPSLRAGSEVEVKGVGTRLSGRYVLTSVEHVLGAGRPYVTRFVSGGRQPGTLVDLLGGAAGGANWGERGLVIGIVTNNKDPDRLGRIKVRFPTLNDDDESWWARVAAVGAGSGRGLSVVFEVDDEVLVGFEQGDVRRPIVLGGLWSKQKRPHGGGKETDHEGVASRLWRSREGHSVEMHDSSGSKAGSFVCITLSDGETQLRLGRDTVTLSSPTDITISSKGAITVRADGDLTLEGANVNVSAKNAAKIDALNTFSARGSTAATVEGAKAELNGTATATVQGGTVAALRGALVKLN